MEVVVGPSFEDPYLTFGVKAVVGPILRNLLVPSFATYWSDAGKRNGNSEATTQGRVRTYRRVIADRLQRRFAEVLAAPVVAAPVFRRSPFCLTRRFRPGVFVPPPDAYLSLCLEMVLDRLPDALLKLPGEDEREGGTRPLPFPNVVAKNRPDELDESNYNGYTSNGKQAAKTLASQIKDMALKASGAYRSCSPCTGPAMMMTPQQLLQKSNDAESDSSASVTDRFRRSYRRTGSKNSSSGRVWGKEMEARLKGISMGSSGGCEAAGGKLLASESGRREEPIVLVEEIEPKEWVAQVEPGVLITFISLPRGGNDLKRIRFSREIFNKWQAQRWWQDNFDKVMELYNVQRLNRQAFPLPMPLRSEDESPLESRSSKLESIDDSPLTPTSDKASLPRTLQPPTGYSSDSQSRSNRHSSGLTVTPKLSTVSGLKTETSSIDASISANSSKEADRSRELSVSNMSDIENEWVEEDEPGVYITIRALPSGLRELRRVRFSREKFGEVHARLWWEENRARIHNQYL
ncbi:hypothetical protein LXL04_002355 [Taraxacum kok-saghyz]